MSISQPLALPPGFEQLSKDQQIDYVQQQFLTCVNDF